MNELARIETICDEMRDTYSRCDSDEEKQQWKKRWLVNVQKGSLTWRAIEQLKQEGFEGVII